MRVKSAWFALALCLLIAAIVRGRKPEEVTGATDASKNSAIADSSKDSPPSLMQRLTSKPVTVPEGAVLTIRLNDTVSSKKNNSGDKFTGTVEEPVEVEGKTVIPKGSTVTGTVTDAQALGKIKGAARLRLVLDSVTVNDSRYDIETTAVARSLKGKGERTAEFGGGGAAAGAVIGAVAGGGKGAMLGGVLGGGAGVADLSQATRTSCSRPKEHSVSSWSSL